MKFRIVVALFVAFAISLTPVGAFAATNDNKGLAITPIRQSETVAAGKTVAGEFTVTNRTDEPMKVSLSVNQFAVKDYSYDFSFTTPPRNNWVSFTTPPPDLKPNEKRRISYVVEVPENATPGGHYFTLIAGTQLPGSGVRTSIQAGVLLYLTVEGDLKRSGVISDESMPFLVTGNTVPYQFSAENTGNVHYDAHLFGKLEGLFYEHTQSGTTHLLMPGAIRIIEGSMPSPMLPGIYKATYGYKTDFSDEQMTKSGYVLFIPPWSIASLALMFLIGGMFVQRIRAKRKKR